MPDYRNENTTSLRRKLLNRIFLCPRGKHERSFEHVRRQGDRYVSKCRGCGVPMVRLAKRNWVIDTRV